MRMLFQSTAVAAALFATAAVAQMTPSTTTPPAATPPASTPSPSTMQSPAPAAGDPAASGSAMQPAPSAGATAGASATPTQGASVYGPEGNLVGTIEAVDAQYATLATPSSKVKLPLSAFGPRDKGFAIGMTQAQIDAAAGPAGAAASTPSAQTGMTQPGATTPPSGATSPTGSAPSGTPPRLSAGTAVSDTKGGRVGTIESVEGEFATVATAKNKVRLPVSAFADAGSGPVIGMTEAELDAAAEAAKPKTAAK